MWQGIHGHDAVVERFRQSLASGRLAASYLFLGPSGIGKRTFAVKLAQALMCLRDPSGQLEPCGACDSCRLIEAGNHPDLDLVGLPEGKRWLPVDLFLGDRDHRNQEGLCHNISLRPQMGRRRVAIIDDADHLTVESSNCLLKTLEEPPPGAVMILIGTSRGRQLPTILSRTQTVRFAALGQESIRQLLVEKEIAADAAQAEPLALACEGSLSKAAELVDPELWAIQASLLPQITPTHFDSVRLSRELTAFVNEAGKEADARRTRMRQLFGIVGTHFRQLLRAACSPKSATDASGKELLQLGPATQDLALAIIDRCLEAEVQLDRNANQATLIECWLDDLATILSTSRSPAHAAR